MKLLSAPAQRVVLCPAFLCRNSFFCRASTRNKLPPCKVQPGSHNLATWSSSSFRICKAQVALHCRRNFTLVSNGWIRDVGTLKTSLGFTKCWLLVTTPGRSFHIVSPNGSISSVKEDCENFSAGPLPASSHEALQYGDGDGGEEDNVEHSDDDDELEGGEMQLAVHDETFWAPKSKTKILVVSNKIGQQAQEASLVFDDSPLELLQGELESGLYLVGTPIGNLEDITLREQEDRALRVLKSATCILAEDTRHSFKLLQHYGINTPTLSYHKFNENAREVELIQRLQRGEVLALISDAGMPGISDPGSELVKACVEANVQVFPIPGPSAALTALVASGLPTNEFTFVGFLSARGSLRQERLIAAAKESATQIFYVPPHKLCRVLDDFISVFGSARRCVVAREMTKLHEEFWRGTLDEAKAEFEVRKPRGELTLIVEGLPERACAHRATEEELMVRLKALLDAGKSPSEATKLVVAETSARRNTVYPLALQISQRTK